VPPSRRTPRTATANYGHTGRLGAPSWARCRSAWLATNVALRVRSDHCPVCPSGQLDRRARARRRDRPTARACPQVALDDRRWVAGNAGERHRPALGGRSGGADVGDLRQGGRGEPPAGRTRLACGSRPRCRAHSGSTSARPPRGRAAPGDRRPNGADRGAAVLFAGPAPGRGPPRPRPDPRPARRTDARATAGSRMRARRGRRRDMDTGHEPAGGDRRRPSRTAAGVATRTMCSTGSRHMRAQPLGSLITAARSALFETRERPGLTRSWPSTGGLGLRGGRTLTL